MLDWFILAGVKVLKFAVLSALALATPPVDPRPLGVPGLDTSCHATIILTVHPTELRRSGEGDLDLTY